MKKPNAAIRDADAALEVVLVLLLGNSCWQTSVFEYIFLNYDLKLWPIAYMHSCQIGILIVSRNGKKLNRES